MKNFISISVLIVGMFINVAVSAQSLKIGYVNVQEIIETMPEGDTVRAKLEKYTGELESQLEEMQVEYNKKLDLYQTKRNEFSELIRKTKEEELIMMQQKIQNFQMKAQQDIQQVQADLLQPLMDKVEKAIGEVAKEQKYTYILDESTGAIAYKSDPSMDISALVKKKMESMSADTSVKK